MAPEISEKAGQLLLEMRLGGISWFLHLKIKNIKSEIEEFRTQL